MIGALRPIYLEDLGLPSALQMLAQDAGSAALCSGVFCRPANRAAPAPEQEIAVYRIAQEALSNVIRHAQLAPPDWRSVSKATASSWRPG